MLLRSWEFQDCSYLTLTTLTKHFAVVQVEGHIDISNIHRNPHLLLFLFRFHRWWPKNHSGEEQLGYGILSSCVCSTTYHQHAFQTSIVVEDAKVHFHLVAWALAFQFTPGVN